MYIIGNKNIFMKKKIVLMLKHKTYKFSEKKKSIIISCQNPIYFLYVNSATYVLFFLGQPYVLYISMISSYQQMGP